jgi:predicted 3-demethylubiquinone-9 3-methyltransferase (glyoxalase superfamily)
MEGYMQKIITHLWFNDQAEEAASLYVSLFENSRITHVARYPEAAEEVSGKPAGSAMTVAFELAGQQYLALNGGPEYTFTEAISLLVNCESQEEIDKLWDTLTADGKEGRCGWLKDKYGLSWQITPTSLGGMIQGQDPEADNRVMAAMLTMNKIDIATLERAQSGE